MKNYFKYLLLLTLLCTAAPVHVAPNHMNADLIQLFTKPVSFNRAGIQAFLTDTFNHRLYGVYGLPASFMHIGDFLSHNKTVPQPYTYTISIVDLFHDRLKEALWVNPYALSQLLEAFMQHCGPLCEADSANQQETIKHILYRALLSQFSDLKKNPEGFMNTVSADIAAALNTEATGQRTELQYGLTHFIESALDKVVWDPREQAACWDSCKLIAEQLHALYRARVIPTETALNHCYWSLTYRFCYFVDTVGEHISIATYDAIKQDIATKNCALFCVEEAEACITSKAKRLQHSVFDNEVKVRAVQSGLWVQ